MRSLIVLIFMAQPAIAHPGHIVDVAGHDHVLAGILIGIAVLGGLLAGLKGGKEADEDASEEEAPA